MGLRRWVWGCGVHGRRARERCQALYLDQEDFGLHDIQTASTFMDISRVFQGLDTKFMYSRKLLVNHCRGEPESERVETGP